MMLGRNRVKTRPQIPGASFKPATGHVSSDNGGVPSFYESVVSGMPHPCPSELGVIHQHRLKTATNDLGMDAEVSQLSALSAEETRKASLINADEESRGELVNLDFLKAPAADDSSRDASYRNRMSSVNAMFIPESRNEQIFRPLSSRATGSSQRQRQQQATESNKEAGKTTNLADLDELPLDWALKFDTTFTSELDFDWTFANRIRCMDVHNRSALKAACAYYQFPPDELPAEVVQFYAKSNTASEEATQHVNFSFSYGGRKIYAPSLTRSQSISSTSAAANSSLAREGDSIQFGSAANHHHPQQQQQQQQQNNDIYSGKEKPNFVFTRRCAWFDAFRSLHVQLLRGNCPYYYVLDPSLGVLLFLGEGAMEASDMNFSRAGSTAVCAILSRSTIGIRRDLDVAGVQFSTPLDPNLRKKEQMENHTEAWEELKQYGDETSGAGGNTAKAKLSRSRSVHTDDSPSTALLFQGKLAVSGLHTVLVNRVVRRGGTHAVPKLISQVQFEQSSIKHLSISLPAKAMRTAEMSHRVEPHCMVRLHGPALPFASRELMKSMLKLHEEEHGRDRHRSKPLLSIKLGGGEPTAHFNYILSHYYKFHVSEGDQDAVSASSIRLAQGSIRKVDLFSKNKLSIKFDN